MQLWLVAPVCVLVVLSLGQGDPKKICCSLLYIIVMLYENLYYGYGYCIILILQYTAISTENVFFTDPLKSDGSDSNLKQSAVTCRFCDWGSL